MLMVRCVVMTIAVGLIGTAVLFVAIAGPGYALRWFGLTLAFTTSYAIAACLLGVIAEMIHRGLIGRRASDQTPTGGKDRLVTGRRMTGESRDR